MNLKLSSTAAFTAAISGAALAAILLVAASASAEDRQGVSAPTVLAQAGPDEELITAELDFTELAKWYDVLPWREWRFGPQQPITRLVAEELAQLGEPR